LLNTFFQEKAYSKSLPDLFERGVKALQKGDLETAEGDFRAVLKEEPDNPFAYFNLGAIFIATRRIDLALMSLSRAVELKPDLVAAHLRLAEIYEGQGNLPEAIREYEEAYLYLTDESTPEGETVLARLENLQGIVEVREKFERGLVLLRGGNYGQSEEMFREVLSVQPKNAQAYNFLGVILGIQNRFDEAIHHFKESLNIKPDLVDSRIRMAELHQIKGMLKDARLELEKALFFLEDKDGPDAELLEGKLNAIDDQIEIKTLMDRSAGEIEEKKNDAAIATLEEVIRLYPKHAIAYFNLGNLFAQKDRFDLAESNFKKAIEIEPDYTEAHQRLGQVYEFIRFFGRAKRQYEKALATAGKSTVLEQELEASILRSEEALRRTKPAAHEALRQFQEAFDGGDLNKAASFLEQAVFLNPENAELHFRLGEIYELTDQVDPAFNEMRGALEFDPSFAAAHQHLGILYEKRGFFHRAAKEWRKAESIAPSDRNKKEMDRLDKKIVEIRKATTPLREKAKEETENGKRMTAIETLRKAVALSPDDIDLRMELAVLYASIEAAETFSELNFGLFLDPDNGEAHYRLGLLYASAGQWQDARLKFQEGLQSKSLSNGLRLKAKAELARAESKLKNEQIAARYFIRGSRRLSEQDYRGAVEAFEKVLSLYPNGVGSLYWIGTAYEGQNNLDEAERYYAKVLALNSNHTLARQRLGFVYETQGKSEKAIQVYQKALDLLGGQASPEEAWLKERLTPLEKRLHMVLSQVVLSYNSNPAGSSTPEGDLSSNLGVALTYFLKKDQRLQIPIGLSTQNTILYRSNTIFSSETFSVMALGSRHPYAYSGGYNLNLGLSRGGPTGMDHVALFSVSKRGMTPSSIGLDYSYDYFFSFGESDFNAIRQNFRFHITQEWDLSSVTVSYRFLDNAAKLNDQVSQTHGFTGSYSRNLAENIRANVSYNIEWVEFLNPDSLARLQSGVAVHRKNVFQSLSLTGYYMVQRNLIMSASYTEQQNVSNLPSGAVTIEQQLSGQASSLGDYRQRLVNLNLSWSF
jgi:tetratricopeptide (TPR) repeat protein